MKSGNRLPVPQYSYRQSIKKEEREVYRRIALIISAFFVILVIIWFFSTNFLSALGSLANGKDSDVNTSNQTEELPLQAPEIDELPESTNNDTITVSGTANAEIKLALFVNDKEFDTKNSDSSGFFKFEKVKLSEGLNLIKITATNKANKKEEASKTITLDKIKPPLAVSQPIDGANLSKDTETVSVAGTTEASAIIHINGNQAVVGSNGKFTYTLPVNAGKNDIAVEAIDEAGNVTTVRISVNVESGNSESVEQ